MTKALFVVSFKDGNEKLYGAEDMLQVLNYIDWHTHYSVSDVLRIEERVDTPEENVK